MSEPHDVEKKQRAHAAARVQSFARGRATRSSPMALNRALRDKQQATDDKPSQIRQSDPPEPSPNLAPPSPLPTAPPPPPCGDVAYDTDEFAETEVGAMPTTAPAPKPMTGVDAEAPPRAPTGGEGKGKGKGKSEGGKGKGAAGATATSIPNLATSIPTAAKTGLDEPD